MRAFVRPGAVKVAGTPVQSEYDLQSGLYSLVFIPAKTSALSPLSRQTEIFVPHLLFSEKDTPENLAVKVKQGDVTWECAFLPFFWRHFPAFHFTRVQVPPQNSDHATTTLRNQRHCACHAAVPPVRVQRRRVQATCRCCCLRGRGLCPGLLLPWRDEEPSESDYWRH